ncbi:MAG: hypothetical protein N2Z74_05035, partial [Syntrophales bacterium]|nr:hypothetical protein [Syntrophales bacterium]
MIRPRVFTILFLFTVTTVGTAFVEAAYGREETARISFRKKIPKETGTWNYVVKKGDHLLEIVRRELGIEQGRHTIIRRYNPHLKNLNKIYPGQIIILPVLAKGDAAPIPIESSPPPKQAGLVTNPSQTPVAEKTIGTIKAVLTRMGITLTAAGRFHIPLPETGEIT